MIQFVKITSSHFTACGKGSLKSSFFTVRFSHRFSAVGLVYSTTFTGSVLFLEVLFPSKQVYRSLWRPHSYPGAMFIRTPFWKFWNIFMRGEFMFGRRRGVLYLLVCSTTSRTRVSPRSGFVMSPGMLVR